MSTPIEIKYSYKGVPTLRAFSDSDAFMRCAMGPFGSGKSSACAIEVVARAMAQQPSPDGVRKSRWIVIRNTYRQLQDSTIRTFHQWFPPHLFGEYKQSEQKYTINALENVHCEILYRALDRPDHVGNLLSLEVTGGWVNESREVPWPIIEALQGRVGRYPSKMEGGASWWGVWMDTNPPDVDSKLYSFFENPELDPTYAKIFKQPSGLSKEAENLDNLPGGREYYRKMAIGKDREFVKVYIHGEYGFVVDGRAVFPEYNDAAHCNEEIKAVGYEPIYRGWDFGLTPSCVFMQVTPHGALYVLDELVADDMGADRFSDSVIEHSSQYYPKFEFIDIGDPAGAQRGQTDEKTCFQILHSKGIYIEPGMQSTQIRLESVRRPLTRLIMGKPGFQVHPRCKTLRKGFMGGYQYRRLQTSAEKYTAVPDKNSYSHVHDALQYPCTRIFGGGLTTLKAPAESPDLAAFEFGAQNEVTGY